jgi:RNA polymerase sigma factor (sigma-70 family)
MDALEGLDDAALLDLSADEPAAFGVFYRRYERHLLRFFLARVRSADVAADLTAETFAQTLLSRAGFRRERGEPRAWLYGIARHVLSRSVGRRRVEARARERLGMAPLVLDDEELERIDALAGMDGRALELLGELPAEQRTAIEARVVDKREYDEIALALACSEQVVRKRVSRGLAALRSRMEGSR